MKAAGPPTALPGQARGAGGPVLPVADIKEAFALSKRDRTRGKIVIVFAT